jgi:hypothetical protein
MYVIGSEAWYWHCIFPDYKNLTTVTESRMCEREIGRGLIGHNFFRMNVCSVDEKKMTKKGREVSFPPFLNARHVFIKGFL